MNRETRVFSASPVSRLHRLPERDRKLLLLLVALDHDVARERLNALADDRRELLAPLLAEVASLPAAERHALFASGAEVRPQPSKLNERLAREPRRLATLLLRELAPRRAVAVIDAPVRDGAFARSLSKLAARWRDAAARGSQPAGN